MNEHELKRYQAGRCDAHGNRMIADDGWYLRGYCSAFIKNNNMVPDWFIGQGWNSSEGWEEIDRLVVQLQTKDAFERGKDVL